MRREAQRATGPLGEDFFLEHILPVRTIALNLAGSLGADTAVVETAALLHDIAALRDYAAIANHHLDGALIAETILSAEGYSRIMIDRVTECIREHSAPVAIGKGSLESVCLSNADAVAQMTRPCYWLYYAFKVKMFSFTEGRAWYRSRLESHRAALIPLARELYGGEYERIYMALYGG